MFVRVVYFLLLTSYHHTLDANCLFIYSNGLIFNILPGLAFESSNLFTYISNLLICLLSYIILYALLLTYCILINVFSVNS